MIKTYITCIIVQILYKIASCCIILSIIIIKLGFRLNCNPGYVIVIFMNKNDHYYDNKQHIKLASI